MAAPNPPSPMPPFAPASHLFVGFQEVHPQSGLMASMNTSSVQPAGQNHDRYNDAGIVPPPPPAIPQDQQLVNPPALPQDTQLLNPPADPNLQPNTASVERPSDSDGGSGSEGTDSEEDDDEQPQFQWRPVEEDHSEPCEDELNYIVGRGHEHSAIDHQYWENKTFFDLDDPDLTPGEKGRIDWLVEHFNGTSENPNKEYVMKSPVIHIGGYDWRIKFYPKGNNTDYLSVYLECVTMQAPDFVGTEDFPNPPLPFLTNMEKLKKRRSVAVQLSVVMYNPAEPRTYEHHADAHQFTKDASDYGWTRFTRYARRDFVFRNHGQRQAILRNDKLAFSAYIRVVQDPTGCLWAHGSDPFKDSIALTGLRPFSPQKPMFAAEIPLLHFGPFRDFVTRCKDTKIVFWMQTLLWKMMSRKHSQFYGQPDGCAPSDTIAWLKFLSRSLRKETHSEILNGLIGTLNPDNYFVGDERQSAIGANRLKTKNAISIQAAVNAHTTALETPALMTLELERQEYDRKERKWKKLTNRVLMEDQIVVSGTPYTLFAFTTHCGDLESNKFNVYVRPHGPSKLWYEYTDGSVSCLTYKQAVDKHSGFSELDTPIKPKPHSSSRVDPTMRGYRRMEEQNEVAHAVTYMRDDCVAAATASPATESWDVPENVRKGIPPKFKGVVNDEPPATAIYETFSESALDNEEAPPAPPEEDARTSSFDTDAGYATPNSWPMDGEDVVMSDADDESIHTNDEPTDPTVAKVTIDHLGREFYKGVMRTKIAEYHGQGHLISMNGDEYVGNFRDGQKDGTGKMIYGNTGNIYEGEWFEDEQHGYGKLTEASTGNVFEGGWKNGRKHGEFVLKGTVTDEDKGCCSICYDKEISTAFYDCGHVIACKDCAHKIDSCPVCRRRVLARLELFGVKMIFE
ncbi:hypothetical protein LTR37_005590 [Vermiconidia calcicola]|uniref:Uncharacterized protein n=1 Tax=Vermiconidia calcicola TaxID=1690605 RepID=A0ACC3NJL6_9PEZI|nr:hypothetical protein LTR37_005590 [Vermiconidia calcicola]